MPSESSLYDDPSLHRQLQAPHSLVGGALPVRPLFGTVPLVRSPLVAPALFLPPLCLSYISLWLDGDLF